jgi:hypothetical protein
MNTGRIHMNMLHKFFFKSFILWDITPCNPLNFNGCFEGTYLLHLHGYGVSQARN